MLILQNDWLLKAGTSRSMSRVFGVALFLVQKAGLATKG